MAFRLPAHLYRNRHGVLYFRLAVPVDLQSLLGQREIYRSLSTSNVRQAADHAIAYKFVFGAFFKQLRNLPMPEKEKSSKEIWDAFQQLPDLRLRLNNAGKQIALEEQQRQLDLLEAEIANRASQHERELDIAIRAKGGMPEPATIRETPTLTEVWESYKAERIALGVNGGWKDGEDTAKYDHWPHIRDFIALIGNKQIGDVTAEDAEKFQGFIIADKPGKESANNKNKRLIRVGALFRWAKHKRKTIDDFSEYFRYPGKPEKNNYQKFAAEDIKALFESDDYRNNLFRTPSEYWIPLLGLFTGGRLNELAQLTVSDIGLHEGVQTISILDGENKRLKNAASRRIIPIHSKLIELGFIDYVDVCGKDKSARIFPELKESSSKKDDFGKEPSRKFTAYRRRLNIGDDKLNPLTGKWEGSSRKVFHSFRSTLIDALRKAGVPKERRTRLAGHEYRDAQDTNYDGGDPLTMFSFVQLKADIECVVFDARFTPFAPSFSGDKV